jgi:hypothetical protein
VLVGGEVSGGCRGERLGVVEDLAVHSCLVVGRVLGLVGHGADGCARFHSCFSVIIF